MHVGRLPLLLTAALLCSLAQAEEPQPTAPTAEIAPALEDAPAAPAPANDALVAQLDQLKRQLEDSERQRSEGWPSQAHTGPACLDRSGRLGTRRPGRRSGRAAGWPRSPARTRAAAP